MGTEFNILNPGQNPFTGQRSYEVPNQPHKIYQIAKFGEIILITYLAAGKPALNKNVYAYDKAGNVLWIIETQSLDEKIDDPYIYVAFSEKYQCVRVEKYGGSYWRLDVETGKVTYLGSSQR